MRTLRAVVNTVTVAAAAAAVLLLLSFTVAVEAAAIVPRKMALVRRATARVTTCHGTGQYPLPQKNVCKPCSWKFPGASVCSATAALRCATGYLSNGLCVTRCPASTFIGNGACSPCSSKFPGAATCVANAATKCTIGYLSGGKCSSVCPAGFVNAPSTRTCVTCNRFDKLAVTCTAGKIATCNSGAYLDSKQNSCVPCNSVSDFASTCSSATVVTACIAPYMVSSDKRSCVLGSSWSYYLAASIPDVPYESNVQTPTICGRNAVGEGSQVAVFDTSSLTCFATSTSGASLLPNLIWDADSTVLVYGTCKTNNLIARAARARCRDVTLTPTSCTLASRASCSTLSTPCLGSQFRNFNGVCQECDTAYSESRTCDLFDGATSCIDGTFLVNGTCSSCAVFDPNASECSSNGNLGGCNAGWVLSNNTCVVDTSSSGQNAETVWSFYFNSTVQGLPVVSRNASDQFACADDVLVANYTLGAYDASGKTCWANNATHTLTGSETDSVGASVYLITPCATTNRTLDTNCYNIVTDDTLGRTKRYCSL
ncbi:BZ3500_MvSof-1268-A1-R1_Chr6-3g08909 [Microbotryum saponariae]|uniref:BZ3500_MvSof-1268-A1-R1_Chr6-3g08909 protein n=1 Tax=Microbotryum saponariae TaxID=289078 RepID=A0A2X0LK69_9BASI|nr:BZ3500_MvSof-1268-A1-R1_Chr6-3g08909 [Microbotryum saponariae]SDA07511.1 BZ3501_MvSof-1269-A2-R1_Chr6-2g08613 [Microbotryum saponariae]